MKKRLKKLCNKIVSKLASCKEYLADQAHYLKQAMSKTPKMVMDTSKAALLAVILLICSVSGSALHERYIEAKVGSNVVFVRSPEGAKEQGMATAFEIVAPSGKVYTLTNAHVCGLQKDGKILAQEKRNSGRLVPIRILEVYEKNDLCILEGLTGYEGLNVADSIDVSDHGTAIGYPLGQELNISSGRIKGFGKIKLLDSDPVCKGENKKKVKVQFIFWEIPACEITRFAAATDVPTFPGNSGSPLVNFYGNVIGVMFASSNETHWGYAVPLKDVNDFLKPY